MLIILTNLTLEQKFFNLNFVCANEAREDDLQKDKRKICWPPFMNMVCKLCKIFGCELPDIEKKRSIMKTFNAVSEQRYCLHHKSLKISKMQRLTF